MKRGGPLKRRTAMARTRMVKKRLARTAEETRGRQGVSARSGGRCEIDPRDPATDWSHRVARSRGGSWTTSNGIDMCARHHREAHAQPDRARALGWHVRTGHDPAAVPILLAIGWVLLDDAGGMTPVVVVDAA